MTDNAAPSRVREIRVARDISSAELARAANIQPPTLSKIELGQRGVTKTFANAIAKALQVRVEDLYAVVGSPIPPPTELDPPSRVFETSPTDRTTLIPMTRDIPVFGTAACSLNEGAFILHAGEVIDLAPRGPKIEYRKDIYALYVEGDSMEPWKRPGQLVYVDPIRRPNKHDRVVVVVKPDNSDYEQAYIKEYIKRDDGKLVLKQYNPDKVIEWPARSVVSIHKVLEPEDIL
ncbi:LexA family transcriptional regulator [Gluconobacter cerinus]|uniref:XRE family transcriptional regulator n=1 Tax=Gluconobacter cerinus TaxID=38307 RepID=UPI00193F7B7A|nr:LexA family transcriptional regulator [Gluconobacter cerinus]MBM3096624.1 LexA family transcriptional regulator [Gluconobacter cerinus]